MLRTGYLVQRRLVHRIPSQCEDLPTVQAVVRHRFVCWHLLSWLPTVTQLFLHPVPVIQLQMVSRFLAFLPLFLISPSVRSASIVCLVMFAKQLNSLAVCCLTSALLVHLSPAAVWATDKFELFYTTLPSFHSHASKWGFLSVFGPTACICYTSYLVDGFARTRLLLALTDWSL
jgi:hypothetical protein